MPVIRRSPPGRLLAAGSLRNQGRVRAWSSGTKDAEFRTQLGERQSGPRRLGLFLAFFEHTEGAGLAFSNAVPRAQFVFCAVWACLF